MNSDCQNQKKNYQITCLLNMDAHYSACCTTPLTVFKEEILVEQYFATLKGQSEKWR